MCGHGSETFLCFLITHRSFPIKRGVWGMLHRSGGTIRFKKLRIHKLLMRCILLKFTIFLTDSFLLPQNLFPEYLFCIRHFVLKPPIIPLTLPRRPQSVLRYSYLSYLQYFVATPNWNREFQKRHFYPKQKILKEMTVFFDFVHLLNSL